MMTAFLGRPVSLVAEVDNTQAIPAVACGNSKKLRHIARTQRVSIGFLHDLVAGGFEVRVEYCRSDHQKADMFTKSLPIHSFVGARSMVGVEPEEIVARALRVAGHGAVPHDGWRGDVGCVPGVGTRATRPMGTILVGK